MKWYSISNGTVNGDLLYYYLVEFVVNSHVKDLGKSLINDEIHSGKYRYRVPLRYKMVQYSTFLPEMIGVPLKGILP